MDFEQSLVYELSSIVGLDNRIFPLSAKEGIEPPFVIYVSSEGEETQTLEGFTGSVGITCEIHVITNSYGELKNYTRQVLDKLKSFWGRQIGENGVFIKSFSFDAPVETIDEEFNFRRSSFDIRVRI